MHSVLTKFQYGFQSNTATTHAILDVLASAYNKINDNKFSCLTLLDFKKAFDTVYHPILLHKLEYYGIRGVANKLLSSFLSD